MRTPRFRVVCSFDPAVDFSSMTVGEMTAYLRERKYEQIENHMLAGQKPTIFHIREVPHELWDSYVAAVPKEEQALRAFRCGVVKVENLQQEDGPTVTWAAKENGKPYIMTDDEVAKFKPAYRHEVGEVIHAHSFLPLSIGDCFRLPPTLVALLEERVLEFRSADASPSSAASNSDEPSRADAPSPGETVNPPSDGGGRSVSATDATAAGTG